MSDVLLAALVGYVTTLTIWRRRGVSGAQEADSP
jgi:hypothetical protein